ncbi:hypothetical protein KAJ87_04235 [Candidatus Pacearchaeota archaeon]|nr:hypothetical protein [Candidatus Pacearchaeota archaeon]
MMQVKKQAPRLKDLLEESNQFYQDLLGYKPEKTSLQSILESQWKEFAQIRGLNPNSSGIYLPRNQIAVIQEQTPLSLFHEFLVMDYIASNLYQEEN